MALRLIVTMRSSVSPWQYCTAIGGAFEAQAIHIWGTLCFHSSSVLSCLVLSGARSCSQLQTALLLLWRSCCPSARFDQFKSPIPLVQLHQKLLQHNLAIYHDIIALTELVVLACPQPVCPRDKQDEHWHGVVAWRINGGTRASSRQDLSSGYEDFLAGWQVRVSPYYSSPPPGRPGPSPPHHIRPGT